MLSSIFKSPRCCCSRRRRRRSCRLLLFCLPILLLLLMAHGIDGAAVMANSSSSNASNGISPDQQQQQLDELLAEISDISQGNLGSMCIGRQHRSVAVPVRTDAFEAARQKADMVAKILQNLGQLGNSEVLKLLILNLVRSERSIETARVVTFTKVATGGQQQGAGSKAASSSSSSSSPSIELIFMAHADRPPSPYAESSVQVDYFQLSSPPIGGSAAAGSNSSSRNNNNSTTTGSNNQQSTTVPAMTPGWQLTEMPWFDNPFSMATTSSNSSSTSSGHYSHGTAGGGSGGGSKRRFMVNSSNQTFLGWWTYPYYLCSSKRWLITYSIPVHQQLQTKNGDRLDGLLSVDVSVGSMDLNQCGVRGAGGGASTLVESIGATSSINTSTAAATAIDYRIVTYFAGTHKCHPTSTCRFDRGHGWNRGGYTCTCLDGYYSTHPLKNATFNGSHVELAYRNKLSFNSPVYDQLYQCLPCSVGCDRCQDDSPCLAPYDWSFRTVLLSVSMVCVIVSLGLIGAVYNYRRLKVFKVASPHFLCFTLLGCAIMYSEMAAIFPELGTASCVATKWTRHMGFFVTYTSLLMKTWRVSLTYRVTSAHKLRLTDRQLLQWMLPILLVSSVYLGAWTLSDPPRGEFILTGPTMRFTQCSYNWWDHSLAIGEFFFLMWGIHVCYSVRHAETYFNETKHISWAVYNIAVTNIILVSFHLLLLPNVGPDMKYLFGFIRTQLSTTVTIALVFGPKFYLVATGRGDEHDPRARARGVTASFSLNGLSVPGGGLVVGNPEPDEPVDLYRENEELKEQLQKLASHIEFCKIVSMGVHNRHLKPKVGGYFSATSPATLSGLLPLPPLSLPVPSSGPSVPQIGSSNVANYLRRGSSNLPVHEPPLTTASSAALVHFDDDSDFLIRRPSAGGNGNGGILRNNNSSPPLVPTRLVSPVAAAAAASPKTLPSPPPPSPPLPSPPPPTDLQAAIEEEEEEEEGRRRCAPVINDDVHIDDSPTAELLPSEKSKT